MSYDRVTISGIGTHPEIGDFVILRYTGDPQSYEYFINYLHNSCIEGDSVVPNSFTIDVDEVEIDTNIPLAQLLTCDSASCRYLAKISVEGKND